MLTFSMLMARWLIILATGWVVSCGWSRPGALDKPVLPPDFSLDVEMVVQSVPQPDSIWPETVPGTAPFPHNVKWPQETLFSIALWYTGSGANWKRLAKFNPKIKPRQIHIGDVILIPQNLLTTRRPLPSRLLQSVPPREKPLPPPSPEQPSGTDGISLYGPIGVDVSSPDSRKKESAIPFEPLQ